MKQKELASELYAADGGKGAAGPGSGDLSSGAGDDDDDKIKEEEEAGARCTRWAGLAPRAWASTQAAQRCRVWQGTRQITARCLGRSLCRQQRPMRVLCCAAALPCRVCRGEEARAHDGGRVDGVGAQPAHPRGHGQVPAQPGRQLGALRPQDQVRGAGQAGEAEGDWTLLVCAAPVHQSSRPFGLVRGCRQSEGGSGPQPAFTRRTRGRGLCVGVVAPAGSVGACASGRSMVDAWWWRLTHLCASIGAGRCVRTLSRTSR